MLYTGIPPLLAAVLSILMLALAFYTLKNRKFFLMILGLIVISRIILSSSMQIIANPLSWYAIVLGSFKDFAFVIPLMFLKENKVTRLLTLVVAMAVLTVSYSDVFYAYESFTRLQKVIFENLNLEALTLRKDLLALGTILFVFFLFLCNRILRTTHTEPLAKKVKIGLFVLSISGLAMLGLGVTPERAVQDNVDAVFYTESRVQRLKAVGQSSLLNFVKEFFFSEASNDSSGPYSYSQEERAILEEWGLVGARQLNEILAAENSGAAAATTTNTPPTQSSTAPEAGNPHDLSISTPQDGQAAPAFGAAASAAAKEIKVGEATYDRVIVIFVESLAFDFLRYGRKGDQSPHPADPNAIPDLPNAMPYLTSLMRKGVPLLNYYSSAYSTDEGLYAAIASRPDFEGDVKKRLNMPTAFSMAKKLGYTTAIFQGTSKYYRNQLVTVPGTMKAEFFFPREKTFDMPEQGTPCVWGDNDARTLGKTFLWIKDHAKDKFLIAIMTINTHPPFYAYDRSPTGMTDSIINRSYYSTDNAIEQFMNNMKKQGLLDDERTLIVITGDHQITHGGKEVLDFLHHDDFTSNRQLPLVFFSKNMAPFAGLKGEEGKTISSAVDLEPTFGDLLGFEGSSSYYGKSLFAPGPRYSIAVDRSGILSMSNGKENVNVDLTTMPEADKVRDLALYKWYSNRRLGLE